MNLHSMSLASLGKLTEAEARSILEGLRWPEGPICPHCGVIDEATRMRSRSESDTQLRDGVYNCKACRKPFTVTIGTVFEGSHIPLSKWLMGFYLFASSKKSLSALQLMRQLPLGSYRSAWHMAHRIRAAMGNFQNPPKMTGVVEADEMNVAGKLRKGTVRAPKHQRQVKAQLERAAKQMPVAVLVSRDGQARAMAMRKVTQENVKMFLDANVDKSAATLHTDESQLYNPSGKEFAGGHHKVHHGRGEYARGPGNAIHSNTAESFNGLFKRAINAAWHHISAQHLDRYLREQVFRWSNRKINDSERTLTALGRVGGIRLYYRQPKGGEGEAGLVSG
jgi:transposase-like protein